MVSLTMPPTTEPALEPEVPTAKQVWFADDSAAGGRLDSLNQWWEALKEAGPGYGYYPKASKTWLIVKEEHLSTAHSMFKDINITTVGHKYLGSYIGTEMGKIKFINDKVEEWVNEIDGLANIASKEPQLAYAALVFGLSKRWSYLMRTTPNISLLLAPLEEKIKNTLIPQLTGHQCTAIERELFSLPARFGGLSIPNPTEMSDREYTNSTKATDTLRQKMLQQEISLNINWQEQAKIKANISSAKNAYYKALQDTILGNLPTTTSKQAELASEKGSSSWLTTLPLEEYGFTLNKQEFYDAISLRYGFPINKIAKQCVCGQPNSINHCLICKRGGFVSLRHNSLRDTTANLLSKVCKDVVIEPPLIPLTGENLSASANTSDEARLDVSARSFWIPLGRAFFDIRVLHPGAPTNASRTIPLMYAHHENEKKRKYNDRVINVEKGSFTPLVFSTTGGMGKEALSFVKHLSSLMAEKTSQNYSHTVAYIRRRLRFDLLKTTLIALRGYRGKSHIPPTSIEDLDMNLERSFTSG